MNSLNILMSNKRIVIQNANKGNIEGVKSTISDSNKFVQLNITPDKYLNYIINVEKKFKQLFKKLLDNAKISTDEYDKICPKGSKPGILYSNLKIHKSVINNLPKFRPILSVINTPGYNIAKVLIPILQPLTHNEFTIKDSFSLAMCDSLLYMAILDVESLFTNISLNETINNCASDLHNKTSYNGKLNKRDLSKLLETITSKSSFIFDYRFYKQVDGDAMSSPLGLTLANAFLCHYEKEWLDNCPIHFKPMYTKNIDYILFLFPSKEYLQLFVDYTLKPLNSGHLRVLKSLSVIERCPLLGENLTKIVIFGVKRLVHYPMYVSYLGYPLLGGFTV